MSNSNYFRETEFPESNQNRKRLREAERASSPASASSVLHLLHSLHVPEREGLKVPAPSPATSLRSFGSSSSSTKRKRRTSPITALLGRVFSSKKA